MVGCAYFWLHFDSKRQHCHFLQVDVTLAAEDRFVQAHRLIITMHSNFFKVTLGFFLRCISSDNWNSIQNTIAPTLPHQHPVIHLRYISFDHLLKALELMYTGQVTINGTEKDRFDEALKYLELSLAEQTVPKPTPSTPGTKKQPAAAAATSSKIPVQRKGAVVTPAANPKDNIPNKSPAPQNVRPAPQNKRPAPQSKTIYQQKRPSLSVAARPPLANKEQSGPSSTSTAARLLYKCMKCSIQTYNANAMKKHVADNACSSPQESFICAICTSSFNSQLNLEQHVAKLHPHLIVLESP